MLNGVQVLLVADKADTQDLFTRMLRLAGAKVIVSSSIYAALETLDQLIPDLIISSIYLADGEGSFLCCYAQHLELATDRSIPVIAIADAAQPIEPSWTFTAGFQLYLSESIAVNQLVEQIALVLPRHKLPPIEARLTD